MHRILPINNYAWSKLGGECAVQMYKNSLILRVCMTEKPFIHKKAFANVKLNFMFHDEIAKILVKILHKKGVKFMGFQDNSGDIIFDVILTDEGRRQLSKGDGSFRITKLIHHYASYYVESNSGGGS